MAALTKCIVQFKVTDPRANAGSANPTSTTIALANQVHTTKNDTYVADPSTTNGKGLTIDLTGDTVTLTGLGPGAAANPTKFPREWLKEYY